MSQITNIGLNNLHLDSGTQIRIQQDSDTVNKYFEVMEMSGNNEMFPPILVFRDKDGSLWIADGHHRVAASNKAKLVTINAEVREGTQRDALEAACTANRDNPLQVTKADRQHAMGMLLKASPDYTNTKLAELLGVSNQTIMRWRSDSISPNGEIEIRTRKDGKRQPAKLKTNSKAETSLPKSANTIPQPEVTPRTQTSANMEAYDTATIDKMIEELDSLFEPLYPKLREICKYSGKCTFEYTLQTMIFMNVISKMTQ